MKNVRQSYTSESDQQIQNIISQIMENNEPESFQTAKASVDDSFLKICRDHSGTEVMKQLEVHFYPSVRFATENEAISFANQVDSPSNGHRCYGVTTDFKEYFVSFRWAGLLDIETGNIEFNEILPAMENFGVEQISTEIAIQTRKLDMQHMDPARRKEENLHRAIKEAYGEKFQGGYIVHKFIFADMQSLMRLEKELLDSTDCMGIADFKEEDKGCTAYLSIHKNISHNRLLMVAIRANQKAAKYGGKYIGWDAFTFVYDDTGPGIIH